MVKSNRMNFLLSRLTTPDPLLPDVLLGQPLTLLERLNLSAALDKLNQQAQAKLNAGDKLEPLLEPGTAIAAGTGFWKKCKLWVEVRSLGMKSKKTEVQITGRLQAIQQQFKSSHRLVKSFALAGNCRWASADANKHWNLNKFWQLAPDNRKIDY